MLARLPQRPDAASVKGWKTKVAGTTSADPLDGIRTRWALASALGLPWPRQCLGPALPLPVPWACPALASALDLPCPRQCLGPALPSPVPWACPALASGLPASPSHCAGGFLARRYDTCSSTMYEALRRDGAAAAAQREEMHMRMWQVLTYLSTQFRGQVLFDLGTRCSLFAFPYALYPLCSFR